MKNNNAIHINSTVPYFAKNRGCSYNIDKSELYVSAISALCWRRYNGNITMITDKVGADYYSKLGIEKLWDNIDNSLSPDLEGINPEMFWAAGKILALKKVSAPVSMVDTDLIIWKKLDLGDKTVVAHREELSPEVYPAVGYFKTHGFEIDKRFNIEVLPSNTAFLYLHDGSIKEFYTSQSVAFMKSAENCGDRLCYMVFAEQRLLSMCMDFLGEEIVSLMDNNRLFLPQKDFTHIWGAKQVLRDNPTEKEKFLSRCRKRIAGDFPEYKYIIDCIG